MASRYTIVYTSTLTLALIISLGARYLPNFKSCQELYRVVFFYFQPRQVRKFLRVPVKTKFILCNSYLSSVTGRWAVKQGKGNVSILVLTQNARTVGPTPLRPISFDNIPSFELSSDRKLLIFLSICCKHTILPYNISETQSHMSA